MSLARKRAALPISLAPPIRPDGLRSARDAMIASAFSSPDAYAQALRPASIHQPHRHPNPEKRLVLPGLSRAREHRHSRKSLSDAML